MFRLHDQTRRQLCLTGFVLLCVVPTVATLAWGVAHHWPTRAKSEARRLSAELGLDVSLEELTYLRPGAVLYEGLRLTDPETGTAVAQCRAVEVQWYRTDGNRIPAGDGTREKLSLLLIASQPEVDANSLQRLVLLLDRVLKCRTGQTQVDVRLAAGELTLRAGGDSQTLTELTGNIETLAEATEAQASFHIAGLQQTSPIRVRVARNRQTTPPATSLEFDTGDAKIPCGVLAMAVPQLQSLGNRCRYNGYLWANETPAGWDVEATGYLFGADMGTLVTAQFPHKLSGQGNVEVQSARFRGGRLEDATGTLAAGPGVISRSLIDAAVDRLHLVGGSTPGTSDNLIPYDQLALRFILNADGLTVRGVCTDTSPGAILTHGGRRLLGEPRMQPQPVVALLQTLVPANEVQVPATRQSDWLMRHLPVPEVRLSQQTATAPEARLRLGRAVPQEGVAPK